MGFATFFSLNYSQSTLHRMVKTLMIVPYNSSKALGFRMWNRRLIRTAAATVHVTKRSKKYHFGESFGNTGGNIHIFHNLRRKITLKNCLFGGLPISMSLFSSNISTPLLLKHFSSKRSGIQKPLLTGRKSRIKSDSVLARFCTAKKPPAASCTRPNIKPDVAKMINLQVGIEYQAGYDYLAMSLYFGRNDVALIGCERFYYDMYLEEMEHSRIFMRYLNMRGGQAALAPLVPPKIVLPKGILSALDLSISMERHVKDTLVKLLEVANKNQDYSLEDMLTNFFILEQEKSISGLTRLMSRFKRMDPDCGLSTYLFDEEMGKTADVREFENENFGPYKSLHNHEKSGL